MAKHLIEASYTLEGVKAVPSSGGGQWEEQAFDFVVTYDRDIIVVCAQALMLRIALSEGPDPSPRSRANVP